MKYTKETILRTVIQAAELYNKNLANKNIIFVGETPKHNLFYLESLFNDYNFLHLTGLEYMKSARQFFNDCINHRLNAKNIVIPNNKIQYVYLKMQVLLNAMAINKNAERIGDYNYSKDNIEVQKIIGTSNLCIGTSNISKEGKILKYYYPRTLLKDKINYNTTQHSKIVAVLSKDKGKELYNEVTYLSQDTSIAKLFDHDKIGSMLDYETLYSKNPTYQLKINNFFIELSQIIKSNIAMKHGYNLSLFNDNEKKNDKGDKEIDLNI